MSFEIIDDMSRADVAFKVRGNDLAALFLEGAQALISIMLQNIEELRPAVPVTFNCTAPDLELLYYDFLQEFIYYKDAKKLLLLPEKVELIDNANSLSLFCYAKGEKIDRARHIFSVDIKAITMHELKISREKDCWTAVTVVDV